jgi:hypothetical protein
MHASSQQHVLSSILSHVPHLFKHVEDVTSKFKAEEEDAFALAASFSSSKGMISIGRNIMRADKVESSQYFESNAFFPSTLCRNVNEAHTLASLGETERNGKLNACLCTAKACATERGCVLITP